MKKEATNTFQDGMVMDLHPMTTPNSVLTNCLNGTLLTFNGNEFVLQNDIGNGRVETAKLPAGFVPVGVKEYGGIIYVASHNPLTNKGQLGCFPSPERNLTNDELGGRDFTISDGDFKKGGEIFYYYKQLALMPDNMVLNPGDQFTVMINQLFGIESYIGTAFKKFVTIHVAIIDGSGNVSYIDDQFKKNGQYQFPIGYISPGSSVDDYRAMFENLQVYTGKKSGRLAIIIELETLDEFSVARQMFSTKKDPKTVGSSDIGISVNPEKGEDVEFSVKFFNSGWTDDINDAIKLVGAKFESNLVNSGFNCSPGSTFSYGFNGFKKTDILKYTITPYTQLGPNSALARTGIIDFSLLGTGNMILNEWRYYIDNDTILINYGLDSNLLNGEYIRSVTFEFFDIYYQKLYPEVYTCKSSISGDYNGNFSETLKFKYDLKEESPEEETEMSDYIHERLSTLKANELIKNNLYLVKIKITTGGLVDNGASQEAVKEFFRFMYTTNIFNEDYINRTSSNFSTIPVDPYKVRLSLERKDIDFKSLMSSSINGNLDPYSYAKKNDTTIPDLSKTVYKANAYQDYQLTNPQIKLVSTVDNYDDTFGDYDNKWLKLTIKGDSDITVKYSNDKESIVSQDALITDPTREYVSLISDPLTEEDKAIDMSKETVPFKSSTAKGIVSTSKYKFLGNELVNAVNDRISALKEKGETSTQEYFDLTDDLILIEEYLDRQAYCIEDSGGKRKDIIIHQPGDKGPKGEYDSITVEFPSMRLRATRRVGAGGTSKSVFTDVSELRPCWYPDMDDAEAACMLGGGSKSGSNLIADHILRVCGTTRNTDRFWLNWTKWTDRWRDDSQTTLFHQYRDDTKTAISYNDFMGGMATAIGSKFEHASVFGLSNQGESSESNRKKGNPAYLTVGGHNSKGGDRRIDLIKSSCRSYFQPTGEAEYMTFSSTGPLSGDQSASAVIMLWRKKESKENDPQYAAINFGYPNYTKFITAVQTLLSRILIVQTGKRDMWIQAADHVAYHGVFNTDVSVNAEINATNLEIVKSPIKLYNDKSFDEETVKSIVPSDWKVDSDRWFKIDDTGAANVAGERVVQQCSYLNIPFRGITETSDLNIATRATLKDVDKCVNIVWELPEGEAEKSYLVGVPLEMGSQVDIKALAALYLGALANIDNIVPKYYHYNFAKKTDVNGIEFIDSHVYFLRGGNITDGKGDIIDGSSSTASSLSVWTEGKPQDLRNLFAVGKCGEYNVPVINQLKGTASEELHQNCLDKSEGNIIKPMKGFSFQDKTTFNVYSSGEWAKVFDKNGNFTP